MKSIKKLFPIKTDRCKIKVIGFEDINWYVDKLKQPFFNEFIDFKVSDSSSNELSARLISLITAYKIGVIGKNEIRAVIIIDNELVGGLTIFNTGESGVFEIGYWVLPQYQGKGIALEVLKKVTNKIECNIKNIKLIKLVIHEDNYRSINLAKKAGYVYMGDFQGRIKRNVVYGSKPLRFV